jgi:hypothetical protein
MSMHLVQILLPLRGNDGVRIPPESFGEVRRELTARFGGLTAFTRAPAEGFWKPEGEPVTRDEIMVFEIMTDDLDRNWWRDYRRNLEARFRQESVVVRASAVQLL